MASVKESFGGYKELHEHFMLNHSGSSLLESAIFLSTPPAALLFWSVTTLSSSLSPSANGCGSLGAFVSEFLILIFPLVFTCTVCADYILVVSSTLLLAWLILVIPNIRGEFLKKCRESWLDTVVCCQHRPFITLFRAYTNIITCLCILAVDFSAFPRKFAKTEISGYGLMDTGTGLFVVANALVSYSPLHPNGTLGLRKTIKSSAPLILLGAVRYLSVSQLDYQTHVSEYGSHWNFFLTLAVTRVLDAALSSVCGSGSSWRVGAQFAVIAFGHELALSVLGLRAWVISEHTPRTGFVSANREGLASLPGYLALHRAGTLVAHRARGVPRRTTRHWLGFLLQLTSASLVAWGVTHFVHGVTGVSRRVADLGYVCWVLAFALSSLTLFLGAELIISALRHGADRKMSGVSEGAVELDAGVVPGLLQAVNYNGLAYFLAANLMTGVVNLSIRTLYIETGLTILILTLYMLILSALVYILCLKKIKLKYC